MTLSEAARERLADIVALQPTKNAELQDRWELDSGSEVHRYLEAELEEYYYRNEDSLICATPEAVRLIEGEAPDDRTVRVPPLQARVIEVIAGPDEDSQSVVAVVHALRDAGYEADTDAVRSAVRSLAEKGILERVQKTVPTYRLALERDAIRVKQLEEA